MNKACEKKEESKKVDKLYAKKDFLIVQNQVRIEIKKGDELTSIPDMYIQNLKTEGVI